MENPVPTDIILHQQSRMLELTFADGKHFCLPCRYLRISSPSAENKHSIKAQDIAQDINIVRIEAVGHYAIKPIFTDGHQTGIFSWQTLYELGISYGQRSTEESGGTASTGLY